MRFVLLFLTSLFFYSVPAQAFAAFPSIFNSTEVESSNLKPFFKWTGMLDRHRGTHASEANCTPGKSKKCFRQEWMGFLDSLKGKNVNSQLDAVNRRMNEAEYILDIINWGVQDYWATPYQFFVKDGDCEDYAIAKYISLKMLGFSPDQMRIVVLQDTNLGVIHAILVVYTGDKTVVLDNQISQVVSADKIYHYSPIYSINESNWWRHRK